MGVFSNEMPLGIHWAVTATTLVILHVRQRVRRLCSVAVLLTRLFTSSRDSDGHHHLHNLTPSLSPKL